MHKLKDVSLHHTALKITSSLKSLKEYENVLRRVKSLTCTPTVDKFDLRGSLEEAIKVTGLETEIRNLVYHMLRNIFNSQQNSEIDPNDPLGYIKRAGAQWDRRVKKSINAMAADLKIPLQGQPRGLLEREEFISKWEQLSNYNQDMSSYRPVYAPKDLLDVLATLRGPPKSEEFNEFVQIPKWEFSHINMPVKNLFELRNLLTDLMRVDKLHMDISDQCQRVLATRHAPLCQQLLKRGITPMPYRGALWSYVLNSQINELDVDYWYKLKGLVMSTDHIVDKLVFKDIQLTASNDDQYFVYEDVLYQVMLCFSRDTEVAEIVQNDSPDFTVRCKVYEGPPSGVVPFHGICMYAAPFCYLYESPIHLYFTFRSFYLRYCHRLTSISTHPQGIVSLCLLYERLLETHEPQLWLHFRDLQIQPIRVVFKWLMRAFSGHLPPEQLLLLWDLIFGFDTLEILPLFAIIILSFRRESLLQVSTLDSIDSILADLSAIKVVPLIQMALARDVFDTT